MLARRVLSCLISSSAFQFQLARGFAARFCLVRTFCRTAFSGYSISRYQTEREWSMSTEACVHIDAITEIKLPKKRVCEDCVKIGATWVHLRTCQQCEATLCCDSSPNQHASKHARATGHPVIASAEPGERWLYCYPDDAFAEY